MIMVLDILHFFRLKFKWELCQSSWEWWWWWRLSYGYSTTGGLYLRLVSSTLSILVTDVGVLDLIKRLHDRTNKRHWRIKKAFSLDCVKFKVWTWSCKRGRCFFGRYWSLLWLFMALESRFLPRRIEWTLPLSSFWKVSREGEGGG